MNPQHYQARLAALLALAMFQFSGHAMAMDTNSAETLAKSNMCFSCHDVSTKKIGPAYHAVATKYKGVADAEAKIIHHVTSGPMVKMPNGQMIKHLIIKTTDQAQLKNLAEWILTR